MSKRPTGGKEQGGAQALPILINYSNHAYGTWTEEQRAAASRQFAGVVDRAFPQIDPMASISDLAGLMEAEYEALLALIAANTPKRAPQACVHIMGEQSFCFNLVDALHGAEVRCYVSTTERLTEDKGNGEKVVRFRFGQFRPYLDYGAIEAAEREDEAEMDDIMRDLNATLGRDGQQKKP